MVRVIRTTIDPVLQERATEIINTHQKDLAANFIFNSAALIIRVETGEVLAYVGNSGGTDASEHGGDVDIIRSLRSTGSILKPILYAGMQQSGEILPNTLIADIPTRFPGLFTEELRQELQRRSNCRKCTFPVAQYPGSQDASEIQSREVS